MKKIYIIAMVVLVALATGCTKLNLDEVGGMWYDAGLGIPVCKYHASVFQVLSKTDTTGYIYTNPEDMSLHVYWTEKQQKFTFDFMEFGSGGVSKSSLDLESADALGQLLESVPEGTEVALPAGVYVCRDTVLYDFEYDSYSEGKRDCIVDSIRINKASIDLGINVQGLKLDKNNYIQLTFKLPTIKECEKNNFSVIISDKKMNVSRIISQFVADFHDQVDGVNIIEMDMEYKIVSSGTSKITKGAKIDYTTQFNLIDYDVAYGNYWQEDPMYSEEIGVKMPDGIREIASIGDSKLLFHNPEITMYIQHNVGADMIYTVDYVKALDAYGNAFASASFNGSPSFTDDLKRPYMGQERTMVKDTLHFDRDFGATNRLFTQVPDSLALKCHVNVGKKDKEENNDFLVNPMQMLVDIEAHMEMTFDAGTQYTLRDTVDAPLAEVDTSFTNYINIDEFYVMLIAQNSLPTRVTAEAIFLDSTYTEVYRKPIELECPEVDERGVTVAPTTQDLRLCFTGDGIRAILETKYIAFEITVSGKDAESMISIHADNAVDMDVSAFAKFKANISGILK